MPSQDNDLHICFFPLMAGGHQIPMIDTAKLFAERGVKCSFITTHGNAPSICHAIGASPIDIILIQFPSAEAGLPEGLENFSACTTPDTIAGFGKALHLLQFPFQLLLAKHSPDCLISDIPWTADIAANLNIPRLQFNPCSYFAHCVAEILLQTKLEDISSDTFLVPSIPNQIKMQLSQLPDYLRSPNEISRGIVNCFREAELKSYGLITNSVYELEPGYVDHYRKVFGRKSWHIGPVSLYNKTVADKAGRGGGGDRASIDPNNCLSWLDTKEPGSVVYICFGSWSWLTATQRREIARGLQASKRPFIWVLRNEEAANKDWMPEGFEEESNGLVLSGWAPQILILNHGSVGGFVTHCGWNSVLEAISAGVALITWPLFAEHFFTERLIVDVLRIGVGVGAKMWSMKEEEKVVVSGEEIAAAVERVMGEGEEGEGMKRRVGEFGEMARRAVEVGGSSYEDVGRLIDEIKYQKNLAVESCD